MRSAQEIIHWLEMGAGARWILRGAAVAGVVALSLLVAWKQFKGPQTEATLLQADVGRQLAAGRGFSTGVNYPQTAALLETRGQAFDPKSLHPSLHHPPLYSIVLGAALWTTERAGALSGRDAAWLYRAPAAPSDGYKADYVLLATNLLLLWLAAWLTFVLGKRLFDPRVGWLAASAVLVSLPLWQQTLAVNGTPLMMVLVLGVFLVWHRIDERAGTAASGLRAQGELALLGAGCGLLFLAEYTSGALVLVALGYALQRYRGKARGFAAASIVFGFAVISGPWLIRNGVVSGHPVALAAGDVALKAGDPTAEPATVRATLTAEAVPLNLRKVANKTLTSLQENVKTRIWSGGAMWFLAFFVAGWLYAFRSATANRLRWLFSLSLLVLLLAQSAFNSGEAERHVLVWLAPLMVIFGAGFFFVLLGSNALLGSWPRLMAAGLLALQAVPLAHDAMAPATAVRFTYPPYFPTLLRGLRTELDLRPGGERFGVMADIPAGVAWYGDVRCWAQPPHLRDFYAISLKQQVGELLLTPRTLDRPFFSELNARPVTPFGLSGVSNRFGEWGEIYAGLVTGTVPREFPLKMPHKVAENLFVLLNPALPPRRGK